MTSGEDDIEALIRSMDGAPAIPETGPGEVAREWRFVRPRPWFDKPVKKIKNGRDAFAQMAHLVKTWSAHEHPETLEDATMSKTVREFFDRDRTLAEFTRENPGALEDALLNAANIRRLAGTQVNRDIAERDAGMLMGGLPHSVLDQFLADASPMRGELLWHTMGEIDKPRLIEFILRASSAFRDVLHHEDGGPVLSELIHSLSEKEMGKLVKKLRKNKFIPRESIDIVEMLFRQPAITGNGDEAAGSEAMYGAVDPEQYRLPEILPPDAKLAGLKGDKILTLLAEYTGSSPGKYGDYLARANMIASGEHAGEIIRKDANRLRELGIDRADLAAALARFMGEITAHHAARAWELHTAEDEARQKGERLPLDLYDELHGFDLDDQGGIWWHGAKGLKGKTVSFRGHHQDPFHAADTFYISGEVGGSSDFLIINEKKDLALFAAEMQPYLIRRACFFQGDVKYRLDPEHACRVLNLIK